MSKLEVLTRELPEMLPLIRGLLRRNKKIGRARHGKKEGHRQRTADSGDEELSMEEDNEPEDSHLLDDRLGESLREAEGKVKELQLRRL